MNSQPRYSQLYPGLLQKNRRQQVEGGEFPPHPPHRRLLCSHETPPGVLCPALGPPVIQEIYGPVGPGPEESHKDDQESGTPPVMRKG